MAIVLGPNQYGKAEVRLVHVDRSTPRHEITDLTVTTQLRGDFEPAHTVGDNATVLPTDTQKNTVYAFAREGGVGQPEEFALRLGRHFIATQEPVTGARISIDAHPWQRIVVDGAEHDHAFTAAGSQRRTTVVNLEGDEAWIVSGVSGLVVLKSTGSEFHGFPRDRYTTLAETSERILATAVTARWRYTDAALQPGFDFGAAHTAAMTALTETFASLHSLALQQTLFAMGAAVLKRVAATTEIRLSMPNKHHFLVDLTPFGLDNPDEVYYAADRPYGLVEATVQRDDGPKPGRAWDFVPGFC